MKRALIALLTCCLVVGALLPVAAQESDNIESFGDKVNVRVFTGNTSLALAVVTTYTPSSERINYDPNPGAGAYWGVGVSWNGLGLSFVKDMSIQSDEDVYGESSYENSTLFFYGRKFGADLLYQRFKGFYISNPEDFGMKEGDAETIRPDLALSLVGVNAYYVLSGDFSMVAAFNQVERQLRSGGSLLFMVSVMRFTVESDGPLVPAAYDGGEYSGFHGGSFYSLCLSPGYAYTLVYENFYLTLGAFIGGGLIYQRMDVASGEKSGSNIMYKTSVKSALGYNGDRLFAGIILIYDVGAGGSGEVNIDQFVVNLEFFAGARF